MKRRVLVVEDNLLNRELLCDWLDLEGYVVAKAGCLKEAFREVEAMPDAVLLDVQLGPEDGLNFAKWIRNEVAYRDMPVIAVTAHAMMTDQNRVLQAGCNACVSKPIDFGILKVKLDTILSTLPS